jgi:hypothetical protein
MLVSATANRAALHPTPHAPVSHNVKQGANAAYKQHRAADVPQTSDAPPTKPHLTSLCQTLPLCMLPANQQQQQSSTRLNACSHYCCNSPDHQSQPGSAPSTHLASKPLQQQLGAHNLQHDNSHRTGTTHLATNLVAKPMVLASLGCRTAAGCGVQATTPTSHVHRRRPR